MSLEAHIEDPIITKKEVEEIKNFWKNQQKEKNQKKEKLGFYPCPYAMARIKGELNIDDESLNEITLKFNRSKNPHIENFIKEYFRFNKYPNILCGLYGKLSYCNGKALYDPNRQNFLVMDPVFYYTCTVTREEFIDPSSGLIPLGLRTEFERMNIIKTYKALLKLIKNVKNDDILKDEEVQTYILKPIKENAMLAIRFGKFIGLENFDSVFRYAAVKSIKEGRVDILNKIDIDSLKYCLETLMEVDPTYKELYEELEK